MPRFPTRILFRAPRRTRSTRLAGIAALALAACPGHAADITLESGRWHLLAVPGDASGETVRSLFADDLPPDGYAGRAATTFATWAIFTYDGARNEYREPELGDSLAPGEGFWMIQATGGPVTLDVPELPAPDARESAECASPGGCVDVALPTSAGRGSYALVGYPFARALPVATIRFATRTAESPCEGGCTLEEAGALGLTFDAAWTYDPAASDYALVSGDGRVPVWSAFWSGAAASLSGASPRLLLPAPGRDEAARLLAQASFGPDKASLADVRARGIEGWINAQLALPVRPQMPRFRAIANNTSDRGARHEIWWNDAVEAEDQLRQRVAFALSEIFVVADTGYTLGNAQDGMVAWYDLLLSGAFGRYRDLLEDVTLSPVMGVWLSMLQNAKGDSADNTRADENFAREVLQLFSIGLVELRGDGTPRLVGGRPVPSFTDEHVEAYARAFTGWSFAGADRWDVPLIASDNDYESPMTPWNDGAFHDDGAKRLLGGITSPAGASPTADLRTALDSIANHPNVAPFLSRQLILKLVTSNPTPAYVRRVAEVFTATGGNLGATVKAILLDAEARTGPDTVPNFGKLREPILRLTHLWRAFDIEPGTLSSAADRYNVSSPQKESLAGVLGQAPLKSPSVFNFFAPDTSPVGPLLNAGLLAPEADLYTDALVLSTTARINRQIQLHQDAAGDNERKVSHLQLAAERALANDPGALLDRLDALLLSGTMSEQLRSVLLDHLNEIPIAASDPESGRSLRVRDAITLIMASPDYLVQM